ncbi:serine/threonine-protein phosphatase 2A activator [Nematocida sp. LUAm3]|nr:serine/threonine-protein phosphatase 2A activator [Nematocida sp. LUAm3]KAI5175727.1 serine/threonine-protein phosphatase 2A activator [Nematocida sp. LUAm2]KAI5178633.1 serine/threonine-protein phosphatase 2A activator [Nematocida sp. LUAm1]
MPSRRIQVVDGSIDNSEMERFKASLAYETIIKYIMLLDKQIQDNEAPGDTEQRLNLNRIASLQPKTQAEQLLHWIVEVIYSVPPEKEDQRYGNKAFITFLERIKNEGEERISKIFFSGRKGEETQILFSYLFACFGNSTRIDYGTGHELHFFCFLIILHILGKVEIESIFSILEGYFTIVRLLILKYRLEPAGSHGMWGIDDYQLLPFLFGSSQFCRRSDLSFDSLFSRKNQDMCYTKALRFVHVHKTHSSLKYTVEERMEACCSSEIDKGIFSNHSPTIYALRSASFLKINKGMIKMYDSVVLSKHVVIQHFISSKYLPT